MDGRPLLSGGKAVTAQDGKKGYIFEQSLEEKALHRWRDGRFTEAEEFLAEQWRDATTKKNILEALRQIFSTNRKFDSLAKLNEILDDYLNDPQYQTAVLVGLTQTFSVDYTVAPKVFYRFEQGTIKLVRNFAPYAVYCYKVYLFFELGILNGLISTRSTNQVDLEYIYYLPFCKAFASSDKFHEAITHFFLEHGQDFIRGFKLKADLESICTARNLLSGEERDKWIEKHKNHPPEDPNSITYRIWKKYARPSVFSENVTPRKISKDAQKRIIYEIHKYQNSPTDRTDRGPFDDSKTDFIIQERWISPADYCPCGSGKIFRDCHLPEVIKSQQSGS
jgi:hypothetical protein